jgi:lipoprotein-anchoring transpeptidase ErfK/SrfK
MTTLILVRSSLFDCDLINKTAPKFYIALKSANIRKYFLKVLKSSIWAPKVLFTRGSNYRNFILLDDLSLQVLRGHKGYVMNFQMLAMKSAGFLTAGAALWIGSAVAAPLSSPYPSNPGTLFESVMRGQTPEVTEIDPGVAPELQRQVVGYPTKVTAGTVIIDTAQTYLYFVLGDGKAIRYGIGVGRDGFTWSGTQAVTRKAEWPDWTPPPEMIGRQPYLPRWMAGGEGNPLGARAIYLGSTIYRIHGTNMPETIGHKVSSGCIRMLNADVIDLYSRVDVGTKIVVLPNHDYVATVAASFGPARFVAPRANDLHASNTY